MRRFITASITCACLCAVSYWAGAQRSAIPDGLPFSPARAAGETIYLSGQIGLTPDGQAVRESVAAETRQTMENLGRVLAEHGCAFDDVVSATVYLRSMDDYNEMNEAYASYFDGEYPARACVGGAEIAFGQRVEISMIAQRTD